MYLKSLVLKGFKSFADKSTLNLNPGITAVVGPNGSGKSNISDAVLWVLGERNAKNLRGVAMEDVIFAGSSKRGRVSVAQVDLILDNSDSTLAVEYSEIVISRRVYRSGESDYLLNGSVVRRMDILEVLHETGLGVNSCSIISQGNLESILKSKPYDRRVLIEEAAGVLKHKQRREKSIKKLASMNNHLLRAKDVLKEVDRQLKPLETRAKRALAHEELSSELARLKLYLAVDDLRTLQKSHKLLEDEHENLSKNLEACKDQVAKFETELAQLQQQAREKNEQAGNTASAYRTISLSAERISSTLSLVREKRKSTIIDIEKLSSDLLYKNDKLKQIDIDSSVENDALIKAKSDLEIAQEKLLQLTDEQKISGAKGDEIKQQLDALNAKIANFNDDVKTKNALLQNVMRQLSEGEARKLVIEEQLESLVKSKEVAQSAYDEKETQLNQAQADLDSARIVEEKCREQLGELHLASQLAQEKLTEANSEIAMTRATISGLKEIERANLESNPALDWVVRSNGAGDYKLASDYIKAPEKIETLVERLLGPSLRMLLGLDSTAAIDSIVHARNSSHAGSLCFLPNNFASEKSENSTSLNYGLQNVSEADFKSCGIRRYSDKNLTKVQFAEEALENLEERPVMLIDLLDIDDRIKSVVQDQISNVCLCYSDQAALALFNSCKIPGLRFLSMSAMSVSSSGQIFAEFFESDAQGTLARKRQLESQEKLLSDLDQKIVQLKLDKEKCDQDYRSAQASSMSASANTAKLSGNLSSLKEAAQATLDQITNVANKLQGAKDQFDKVHEIVKDVGPKTENLKQEILDIEQQLKDLQSTQMDLARQHTNHRRTIGAMHSTINDQKIAVAKLQEAYNYATRVLNSKISQTTDLKREIAVLEKDIHIKLTVKSRLAPLQSVLDKLSQLASMVSLGLEKDSSDASLSSSSLYEQINETSKFLKEAHGKYENANESHSNLNIQLAKVELQVTGAINEIVQNCSTTLDIALELPPLEDRQVALDRSFKINRRLANIGMVNPNAAAEYNVLKDRRDFLFYQLEDLKKAQSAIEKIVATIDAKIKVAFDSTFEMVKKNFQDIFSVLFPGGNAVLELVEVEGHELPGVQLHAQPNGKKLTKMSLLSGGEKSLTALALIFAVYKIRSAPFFILDEVEAALDDSNLQRLCLYLDSIRNKTQLILITHQRRTMEMADVLYGVSMQGDGVTKLLGQKLDRDKK